jgi:hypothetical protein
MMMDANIKRRNLWKMLILAKANLNRNSSKLNSR